VLAALLAVAGAVLLLVIGWLVLSDVSIFTSGDDGKEVAGDNSAGVDPSQSTVESPDDEAGTVLQLCSVRIAEAEDVVAAASAGVSHWNAHVQARTDLLEGRISEEEMEAVWKRTQDAGPDDQERFNAAQQAYGGQSSCDELRDFTGLQTPEMTNCLDRSAAAATAVSAADSAMTDWSTHLHHMSEYADGGMTSGRAQRLWVSAWREAPENISAYDNARATLTEAPTCAGTNR
jgi:hypothetical protein